MCPYVQGHWCRSGVFLTEIQDIAFSASCVFINDSSF